MIRAIVLTALFALAIALLPSVAFCAPPTPEKDAIKKLIDDFTSRDWDKVRVAKDALESRQAEAIPALVALLDRDERVELRNTADLIYPGAKEFYGHGGIVYYDIDWISARAGWALEKLTFQEFGFREDAIKESDLFKAAVSGQEKVQLKDPAMTEAARKQLRAEAGARAKAWWQKSRGSWNRFDAVLEALRSDDPVRQVWTFQWIRNGSTRCDGLNMESFKKHILPEVERLAKSTDTRVREEVRYLLEDEGGWWLRQKTERDTKAKDK
jgi:hypothetical protein